MEVVVGKRDMGNQKYMGDKARSAYRGDNQKERKRASGLDINFTSNNKTADVFNKSMLRGQKHTSQSRYVSVTLGEVGSHGALRCPPWCN